MSFFWAMLVAYLWGGMCGVGGTGLFYLYQKAHLLHEEQQPGVHLADVEECTPEEEAAFFQLLFDRAVKHQKELNGYNAPIPGGDTLN